MITPPSNQKISLLPEHIIDQIKAGEVIERPATLIKELLENSIDAGSDRINIHIINYGLDLISVEDNGVGIDFDDLPLAFCRHATSKIDQFEDLYSLYTYGFRGEALASMASVSKVTCSSNKKNTPRATIKIDGGLVSSHIKEDRSQKSSGTSIYVKDLFYNTPVRMKFLQSQTSEKNQLKKIINAFILTHPEVEFSIKWDEAIKEVYPKTNNLEARIKKLFEKKKNPLEIIHFESEYDNSKAQIFLSLNSSKGNAGKFQYIFINGRFVQDVQIHKIILNSAQSLWPFGQSGNYIIFLTVSPNQLDVNVHPNKTVIKLFAASSVFSLISSSIKKHLPKNSVEQINNIPSQSNFSLEKDHKNFSQMNYRSQDFTNTNSLENYFSNLDNVDSISNQVNEEYIILFKDQSATIIENKSIFYLIDNKKFFFAYLIELISLDKERNSTPLLVSSPISIEEPIDERKIKELSTIGFELDFFDEQTVVLRAFPSILSSFVIEDILKLFINKKVKIKNTKVELKEAIHFDFIPTLGNLKSMISLLGISFFIEKNCLKKIKGKDLLNLFRN